MEIHAVFYGHPSGPANGYSAMEFCTEEAIELARTLFPYFAEHGGDIDCGETHLISILAGAKFMRALEERSMPYEVRRATDMFNPADWRSLASNNGATPR